MRYAAWIIVPAAAFIIEGSCVTTGSFPDWSTPQRRVPTDISRYRGVDFAFDIGENIMSVALSGDGKIVATGSWDCTARVFDIERRSLRRSFAHIGPVRAVALSPDGRYLATGTGWFDRGGRHGHVKVFSIERGNEIMSYRYDALVFSVAFSPDGRRLASGASDDRARVYDIARGREIFAVSRPGSVYGDDVDSVAFSADGTLLAVGETFIRAGVHYNKVRVIDIDRRTEVREISHDGTTLTSISLSPDGKLLAVGSSGKSALFNDQAGRGIREATSGGYAAIYGFSTGELLHVIAHESWVNSVAFTGDGKRLLAGSGDATARLIDAETGAVLRVFHHCAAVGSAAISRDGSVVATGSGGKILIYLSGASVTGVSGTQEPPTSEILTIPLDRHPRDVSYSVDGRHLVLFWGGILDAASGRKTGMSYGDTPIHRIGRSVAADPDGKIIFNVSTANFSVSAYSRKVQHKVRILDVVKGKEILTLPHGNLIKSVAISPDGRYIATGGYERVARIFDRISGKVLLSFKHGEEVYSVAFSPDGSLLATGSSDCYARIFDIASRKEVCRFHHPSKEIHDRPATVFDLPTHKWVSLPRLIFRTGVAVDDVAFSPDGKRLATAAGDYKIRVFDIAHGRAIHASACGYDPVGGYRACSACPCINR